MLILNCSGTLGTCCGDPGLVSIFDIVRKILELIQIIVPILLLIMASVDLFKLVKNPDEKNGLKKLLNKFDAAVIVFMVPIIVNAVFNMMPDSFSLSDCWAQSKNRKELLRQSSTYINPDGDTKKTSLLLKPDDYESGVATSPTQPSTNSTVEAGNATENEIVAYAKQFIGKPYQRGGSWNGELPYKATDCVGFVRGVYKHFGINIPANQSKLRNDESNYTVVTDQPKHPGDIALYDGHWAMLTGNGNEIIHAMSPKVGIRTSSDYRKSGKALIAVVRVNAVSR